MPELPEVETVRRGLERTLRDRRLEAVAVRRRDLRKPVDPVALNELVGRRCVAVDRRSKYLLIAFDGRSPRTVVVHLGMSGRLFVDEWARGAGEPPPFAKHEHVRLTFEGRYLRFEDPRRFGLVQVTPTANLTSHDAFEGLGPEPLTDEFDGAHLYRRSRGRKISTKCFLMDAKNVVGVGNIYASEACFHAGVRPRRRVGALSRPACKELAEAVKFVLEEAIAAGGTTLRDYRHVDREAGYFARQLAVYGRAGQPCRRCGDLVRRVVETGRSTYYCPNCQH